MNSEIQSILIPRKKFNINDAYKWIFDNGFKVYYRGMEPDRSKNFIRFRQENPKKYRGWFTVVLPNDIRLIFGILKRKEKIL